MPRQQSATVVSSLLLLFVLASQVVAYTELRFGLKLHSLPSEWEYDGHLVLCLTEDGSTCYGKIEYRVYPEELTDKRKVMIKQTPLPAWTGSNVGLIMRETSRNRTAVMDVSHLELRGAAASVTFLNSIDIDLRIRCVPSFYGPECLRGCQAAADHHDCDSQGNFVCLNGMTGPMCDEIQAPAAAATVAPIAQALVDSAEEKKSESTDHAKFIIAASVAGVAVFLVVVSIVLRRRRTSTHIRGQLMEA